MHGWLGLMYLSEKNLIKTLRQDVTITRSFYCLFFQQTAIIQIVVEGYYFGKDSVQTKTGFVFSGTVDSAFAGGKQKHKVVMRFHDTILYLWNSLDLIKTELERISAHLKNKFPVVLCCSGRNVAGAINKVKE